MFDPIIILIVLTIAIRESVEGLPFGPQLDTAPLTGFLLGGIAAIIALAYALNALAVRRFDATGDGRMVIRVYRIDRLAKAALGAHWLVCTLWLDWVGISRDLLGGNLVVVDEVVAAAPALVGLFLLYGLTHPIQTRLREASMARWLDEGLTFSRPPGFWEHILETVRHRALIILIPVLVLSAASEAVDRLFASIERSSQWFSESEWAELLPQGLYLLFALGVLCLMPVALRVLWRTSRLEPGPLRDRLESMCRDQGVRVRDILIWHTSRGMLNGALIGVLPQLRYILLTDGLLERLPGEQLEAVMAHEIAHARRHHLPWLLGAMVAVVTICTAGLWLLGRLLILGIEDVEQRFFWADVVSGVSLGVALVIAFLAFGYISRRFERQADAFATQHLSGVRFTKPIARPVDRCPVISGPATEAMSEALATVASVAGMPPDRFSYRHGSIASRRHAVRALACLPALRLPIDRVVARLKLATVVLLLVATGLTVLQIELEKRDREAAKRQAIQEWMSRPMLDRIFGAGSETPP